MKKANGSMWTLTEETADARLEFFRLERLLYVVVGTRIKRTHDILLIAQRTEHQDRHILPGRFLTNLAKQGKTVNPGQQNIKDDHIRRRVVGTDVLVCLQAVM